MLRRTTQARVLMFVILSEAKDLISCQILRFAQNDNARVLVRFRWGVRGGAAVQQLSHQLDVRNSV